MHDNPDNTLPCADKANYSNKKQAHAAALVAKHQHGTNLRPYHCKYCDLWHLASDYS